MHHTWRLKECALICIAFTLASLTCSAQTRLRPESGGATGGGVAGPIRIRELTGHGPRGLVRTPEYSSSISRGRAAARNWAELLVQFDSEPEWIDEISFQYYVLVQDRKAKDKTKEFMFLKGLVTHVDVARGRGHLTAMYVRPSVMERYGDVVAVAVEVVIKGETVAVANEGRLAQGQTLPSDWWKTLKLIPRDGYLLNRSQTPFAFINYDDYEVVK